MVDTAFKFNILKNKQRIILCILLLSSTLSVFWQVGGHEFINMDDFLYITENPGVRLGFGSDGLNWAFTSFRASNWHPLTWLSHMLDYKLFALNPAGHHLMNLFFHAVNTLLLFWVLSRMTHLELPSAFVAGLFALHPLHVESVAWAAERKDVLSAFFWFLTMGAYTTYVRHPGVKKYIVTLLLFSLGLMAKPMLVTLPFVLILLDYWPLERFLQKNAPGSAKKIRRVSPRTLSSKASAAKNSVGHKFSILRAFYEKTPFFLLSALSCIVTYTAQEKGGAITSFEMLSFPSRLANAAFSYACYMAKMIYPSDLSIFYPFPGQLGAATTIGSFLLIGIITVGALSIGRRFPYFPVGWFWFVGTLIPVIGLVQVGLQSMADRYTYIPLIGLFIVVAWGSRDLARKIPYGGFEVTAAACFLLAASATATWFQLQYWHDSKKLFQHAAQATENNYLAHNNLGVALAAEGRAEEASRHYRESIRIRPHYDNAHFNLANYLAEKGEKDAAVDHYLEALRTRPNYSKARNNLGALLSSMGRYDEAVTQYLEALKDDPLNPGILYNIAMGYAAMGHQSEAVQMLTRSILIRPDFAEAHNELGIILAKEGKIEEAVTQFNRALAAKPGFDAARKNLEIALKSMPKRKN